MAYGRMWATRVKKSYPESAETGQFWRSTMIDIDTRLRAAHGIAKTETAAAQAVFETLQRRGHPDAPPPTVSDGWGGNREAMVAVYGQIPAYCGRGRPPSHKQPQPGWQYLQIVKHRDQQGRLLSVERRVIYGDEATVLAHLGKSTAYVERTHLTMRLFNSRLTRKSLGFSKALDLHKWAAAWQDAVYNLVRPHKSLRRSCADDSPRRWQLRTPAMAANLTDHIWTVKELLSTVPLPFNNS